MTSGGKRLALILGVVGCFGGAALLVAWIAGEVLTHTVDINKVSRTVVSARPPAIPSTRPVTTRPTMGMSKAQATALAAKIDDANEAVRNDALKTIGRAFHSTPEAVAGQLASVWLEPLARNDCNQQIADWTLIAMCVTPARSLDMASMEKLLDARVTALLAMKKDTEALEPAKSYYNFVRMKNTQHAIDRIAECLAADPKTIPLAEKFRAEQAAGQSATQPATQPFISTVLQSIKIDSKPYDAAIAQINKRAEEGVSGFDTFHTLLQRGNRLLLADKPAEAETLFRQAYEFSRAGYPKSFSEAQVMSCAESIARAMRAQDGTLGRAQAYLSSVPKPSAATQPATNPAG